MKEEDKEAIARLIQETSESALPANEPSAKPKAPRSRKKKEPVIAVNGNGNQVAGGDINNTTHIRVAGSSRPKIEVLPPPGSIGANPLLRVRIDDLFKQINDFRHKRLGKSFRFSGIHGDLAKAFGLKSKEWRQIWLWQESRADEVIAWLEAKRDNTQQGRIEKAARGEGYRHTRPHLFRIEKECLEKLGWDGSSPEVRAMRYRMIGKESRADMSYNELARWVAYVQEEVKRFHGE
ncbi:hypothetical protein SAMN02949497_1648 [Methylomagnum ishizawai]|uniref:Uncharacterized protein n=1 Tax=Methylomagnum ishizawai TaxID=1760988 RepID=A0A1Y6CUM9_9GAMM|nr:hypothetical protein [Methylomagnum ishizawai]SMF94338.1 hypothetical protein SAMN02949497_1648 [Methylomagnum ishizawai]